MTTATRRTPPQHGERRCYLRGCRRPECCAAQARYCKEYRLRTARGGPIRVSVEPAAERARGWSRQGFSHLQIATACGCSEGAIQSILSGSIRSLTPANAARIMAARIEDAGQPMGTLIDATGTRRRLQALVVLGWPLAVVARHAGIAEKTTTDAIAGKNVQISTARVVAAAYDQLAGRRPERHGVSNPAAGRARAWARRHNWYPPIAWDDDTIDDPATEPSLGEHVPRYMAIAEDAMWLAQQDFTREQIADRLGVTRDRVQQSLRKHQDATAEQTLALEEEGFDREQIAEQLNVTTDYLQYALSRHAQRQEQTTSTPDLTGEIGELEVAA